MRIKVVTYGLGEKVLDFKKLYDGLNIKEITYHLNNWNDNFVHIPLDEYISSLGYKCIAYPYANDKYDLEIIL